MIRSCSRWVGRRRARAGVEACIGQFRRIGICKSLVTICIVQYLCSITTTEPVYRLCSVLSLRVIVKVAGASKQASKLSRSPGCPRLTKARRAGSSCGSPQFGAWHWKIHTLFLMNILRFGSFSTLCHSPNDPLRSDTELHRQVVGHTATRPNPT